MTRLLVATRNRGKQDEFRTLLGALPCDIVFPDEIGLTERPEEATLERFETFEENARAKARYFATLSGLPTLADDAGIEVDALGGAPGVHSRRFAGVDGPDHDVGDANNAELLRRLAGVPMARRTARYRGVLLLVRGAEELLVEGICTGHILTEPRGTNGFGCDPIFFSDDLGMTFAEATAGAKHAVSHRGRAVAALIKALGPGTSLDWQ